MPTIYFATIRLHATGSEVTYEADSMMLRALFLISTSAYADLVVQGER